MTGYKIGIRKNEYSDKYDYCLIELKIPVGAKTVKAKGSFKYRCNKAYVKRIQVLNLKPVNDVIGWVCFGIKFEYKDVDEAESWIHREDIPTKYRVGEMVYADKFSKNKDKECAGGIHFFADDQTALMFLLSNYGH